MEIDFGNPRQSACCHVLDAGLRGAGHRDRISVATQSGGQPKNIDLIDRFGTSVFFGPADLGFPHRPSRRTALTGVHCSGFDHLRRLKMMRHPAQRSKTYP